MAKKNKNKLNHYIYMYTLLYALIGNNETKQNEKLYETIETTLALISVERTLI